MRLVSTAAEVRELDQQVIELLGLPGVCLMELASKAVAVCIASHFAAEAAAGVVVVCGAGNNGGDGYGCARWLASWGFPVAIWSLSPTSPGDAGVMRSVASRAGIREVDRLGSCGLIVDAVFGTGLARPVEGRHAEVLAAMASHPAPVVAVDVPSGVSANTGAVLGVAVPAARTVTFGRLKTGLLGEPACDLAGIVEVVDIGLGIADVPSAAEVPEGDDLAPFWPSRGPGDHKTRSGHLLILAGSTNLAGAAVLACRGALAAGVGLLTLAVPRGALPRLAELPPEVMVFQSGDADVLEPLPALVFDRRTAVAAGPGLAGGVADLSRTIRPWLEELWRASSLPVVFDADALVCATGRGAGPRVITPHPGEAGRLLGCSALDIQADRFGAAHSLASDGRVALLKGRNTLVAEAGHRVSVNPTGSAALATGGSGDVLTGVVGALLARGCSARDAARLGAYVHGRAGELLSDERSQGWTAGDIADAIPHAVEELLCC